MPLRKGDLVLTSEPFVMVVNTEASLIYCNYCMEKAKEGMACEVTCPHCRSAKYCSDECFDKAWKNSHRFECEASDRMGRIGQPFSPMTRLIASLIIKLNKGGADEEEWIDLENIRTYADLKSHNKEFANDQTKKKSIEKMYEELKEILKGSPKPGLPPYEEFLTIYGKAMINTYPILDDWLTPIGYGLYLAGAMVDHSCYPNAFVSFRGPVMVFRSLIEGPEKELSQARINYVDFLSDTVERQKYLQENYYFTCHCHLCSCPLYSHIGSAVKCQNAECSAPIFLDGYNNEEVSKTVNALVNEEMDLLIQKEKSTIKLSCCEFHKQEGNVPPVPVTEGQMNGIGAKAEKVGSEINCSSCGHKNSVKDLQDKLSKLVKKTKEKLGSFRPSELPSYEDCTALVEEHGDILHPFNPWKALVLDTAFRAAIRNKNAESAAAYGLKNAAAFKFHYGYTNPYFGVFLLQLGKVELVNGKAQFAVKVFDECKKIMKNGLGAGHPLLSEITRNLSDEAETIAPKRNEEIENLLFVAKNFF